MVPRIWRFTCGFLLILAWAAAVPAAAQELVCSDCHDVDPASFEKTVHGSLACTDCHTGAEEVPHAEGVAQVDCSSCHADAVDALSTSVHGMPVFTQISGKPACQTCHGPVHALVGHADPASTIHPTRIANTCAACHASPEIAKPVSYTHLTLPTN